MEGLCPDKFPEKKNTAHAAQRWFCRGESAAKWIACVAGRYVLSGQSSARSGGYHSENRPLPVAAFNEHEHILWIFLEQSTRTVGFTRKIPLYAKFVKRVLENLLKWRGNSMTYLASIGITNAVLACISCSENEHRKARWQQNDNDFCIKNIVQICCFHVALAIIGRWCSGGLGVTSTSKFAKNDPKGNSRKWVNLYRFTLLANL